MLEIKIGEIDKAPHLLADLAELLVLVEDRPSMSAAEFHGILQSGADEYSGYDARAIEKVQSDAQQAWEHLRYRFQALAGKYPFSVHNDNLCQVVSESHADHAAYGLCLLCSRIRSFDRSAKQPLADAFEEISRHALQNLLPHWVVKRFGAAFRHKGGFFPRSLPQALVALGNAINAGVIETQIGQQSASGDLGIDLVAWSDLKDQAYGSPAAFAQCAAYERDWNSKMQEAHHSRFGHIFSFAYPPMNLFFVPAYYRRLDGRWIKDSSGCILFDRERIVKLITEQPVDRFTKELESVRENLLE